MCVCVRSRACVCVYMHARVCMHVRVSFPHLLLLAKLARAELFVGEVLDAFVKHLELVVAVDALLPWVRPGWRREVEEREGGRG